MVYNTPWYVSSLYLSVTVLPVHPSSDMSRASSAATSSSFAYILAVSEIGWNVLPAPHATGISNAETEKGWGCIPLSTDALALLALPRRDNVGRDAKVRLKEERQAELAVEQRQHRALLEDVPARLRMQSKVSLSVPRTLTETAKIRCQWGRTLMPMESSSRSFTRPTPGTLRMERSCVNALIAAGSKSSLNCPLGLFCVSAVSGIICVASTDVPCLNRSGRR